MVIHGCDIMDGRFTHLLQPIRDLTKNWEIDLASELEEYLEEVEKVAVTFDGGSTTMNFVEAAMLIQGSACVYSKKVEYLYILVYHVLDLLANKKKLNQASSMDAEGNDKDANFPQDADEEFLSLDDLKEHKNIDMKNDTPFRDNAVRTLPQTPLSLIPLDDGEKGENPLMSKKGEVLASRKDFKMNTSLIHSSGVMLLDLSHLSLLQDFGHLPTSTPYPQYALPKVNIGQEGDGDTPARADSFVKMEPGAMQDLSMDDNDGGFPDMDGMPDLELEGAPQGGKSVSVGVERRMLRNRDKIALASKPIINPWKLLDPHDNEGVTEKEFKAGRCSRLPARLKESENRKRKKNMKNNLPVVMPLAEMINKQHFSHTSKFPKNPLKIPAFAELEHLYWQELKRRQALHRREKKELALQGRYEELAEREADDQAEDAAADDYDLAVPPDLDDDEDYGGPPCNVTENLQFGDPVSNTFGDPMNALSETLSGGHASENAAIITSYEDLVRHHVDGFMASAQQYAHITELSRRVAEWEEKIIPRLQDEETHPPFDIHEYGSAVISRMKNDEFIPFKQVVSGKEPFEICRLFLSTLQLANAYNVEIRAEGTLHESMDTMALKLLNTKRHFAQFSEYRAPSIEDT